MIKIKRNFWWDLIFVFVILFFSFQIFYPYLTYESKIISGDIELEHYFFNLVTQWDHSMHFYQAWFFDNYIFGKNSIFAWSPFTTIGYPMFLVAPPFAFLFISLVNVLVQNIFLSYNFIVFLSYLLPVIFLYIALKILKINGFVRLVVVLLYLFDVSQTHKPFIVGSFHFYLALSLLPIFIVVFHKIIEKYDIRKVVFLSIIMTFSILIHPSGALVIFYIIFSYFLSSLILYKRGLIKLMFKIILPFILITFGLIAWYALPIAENIEYVNKVELSNQIIPLIDSFINGQKINFPILIFGLFGVLFFLYKRSITPLAMIISSLFLFFASTGFKEYGILRYLFYPWFLAPYANNTQLIWGIPIVLLILGAIGVSGFIKRLEIKPKVDRKIYLRLFIVILIISVGFIMPITTKIQQIWQKKIDNISNSIPVQYKRKHSLEFYQLLNFLNGNVEKTCRVAYEPIGKNDIDPTYIYLLPVLANISVTSQAWDIRWYNDPWTYNPDDLKLLNAKYVVALSDETNNYLKQSKEFKKLQDIGNLFIIYELKNYSCFLTTSTSDIVIEEQKINNNEMIFGLKNAKIGDEMIIKMSYFPAWKAYVNGQEVKIKKYKKWNLMEIELPRDGNYTLELKYGPVKGIIKGVIISVVTLIISLVLLFRKSFFKNLYLSFKKRIISRFS